jgi:predicted RNase H-like HicB family nuclease
MLREKGISLQKLRKCLVYLKTHAPQVEKPLVQLRLLTDGDTIFVLTRDPKVMVDTLRKGQLVWSFALGEVVEEVRGKVMELIAKRDYKVPMGGKTYRVELQPDLEDGGYVVDCSALPGCMSQGDTVEEALSMIRDVIRGHLAVLRREEKSRRSEKVA